MHGLHIPPAAAPYVLWATEHITWLGLAGVCLLCFLYALKSWLSNRRWPNGL
ncbi:MAG TPA: hypothetical protein VJN96_19970 [Vicinamibacterales bacterium]|nr:hypothetical protein [Vicinamibacterales bacterium]